MDRLHTLLGTSKLSFASEDRLMRYLGLTKGAVTPLGILNDHDHAVEVVLDRDLEKHPRLGVHPCVNTATVWLAFSDLRRLIEENRQPNMLAGSIVKRIEKGATVYGRKQRKRKSGPRPF